MDAFYASVEEETARPRCCLELTTDEIYKCSDQPSVCVAPQGLGQQIDKKLKDGVCHCAGIGVRKGLISPYPVIVAERRARVNATYSNDRSLVSASRLATASSASITAA
jgi:hypothetical protein